MMDKALLILLIVVTSLIIFGLALIYSPAEGIHQSKCVNAVCQIERFLQHILEEEEKQTRLLELQTCLLYLQTVDRARFNEREINELCGIPPFVNTKVISSSNGSVKESNK